ncbi:hypothetical protein C8F01DRAFT_1236528 [Mycena amicta]|nr:hypothetical protein C8F01DRAFT_1236528 [Mycena amicta]
MKRSPSPTLRPHSTFVLTFVLALALPPLRSCLRLLSDHRLSLEPFLNSVKLDKPCKCPASSNDLCIPSSLRPVYVSSSRRKEERSKSSRANFCVKDTQAVLPAAVSAPLDVKPPRRLTTGDYGRGTAEMDEKECGRARAARQRCMDARRKVSGRNLHAFPSPSSSSPESRALQRRSQALPPQNNDASQYQYMPETRDMDVPLSISRCVLYPSLLNDPLD